MLTVELYQARNGCECANALLVINSLTLTSRADVTFTHSREEDGGYTSSPNLNSNVNFTASIYKDKAAYDAGATPIEAVQFVNKHYNPDQPGSTETVLAMSIASNDTLDSDTAFIKAYEAIQQNLQDQLNFI